MKVSLALEAVVGGGAGRGALGGAAGRGADPESPGLSYIPQPSAPSLALTEVCALDRTSASVPQAGEGSTATWVS